MGGLESEADVLGGEPGKGTFKQTVFTGAARAWKFATSPATRSWDYTRPATHWDDRKELTLKVKNGNIQFRAI